jgi:glutathione S-transferase
MSPPPARLVTIPISHYCEKARWALDRAGLDYHEDAHIQGLHRLYSRRAGGRGTAPVLVCADGTVLADSADILVWADANGPAERRLYPGDPVARAAVHELERDFDSDLGPNGRRWIYAQVLEQPQLAYDYGCAGAPAWERRALPIAYPLVSRFIERAIGGADADAAARSDQRVQATFDRVADRLSDGRRYLCGDRFTGADLTFAALAGAVLLPERWGIELPPPERLPAPGAARVRELRTHPAGRHALRMFEQERPARSRQQRA